MKASDFRNLDFTNIGSWAQSVKIAACVLLFGLLVAAGWYFLIWDQQEDLKRRQTTEEALMRDILRQLLRQLPSKTEMPGLLVDVSQTALSAGLETQLFQPGPETVKEGFYAEKPIALRMRGTYHQFGTFISGVAALPRVVILTMHNVALRPVAGSEGQLMLQGTVKTYRYVEDDESEKSSGKAAPAKKGAPARKGGG
jgi:type IV pilus assembly protein PilO